MTNAEKALLVALNCLVQSAAWMQELTLKPVVQVPGGNRVVALERALRGVEDYMLDVRHLFKLVAGPPPDAGGGPDD